MTARATRNPLRWPASAVRPAPWLTTAAPLAVCLLVVCAAANEVDTVPAHSATPRHTTQSHGQSPVDTIDGIFRRQLTDCPGCMPGEDCCGLSWCMPAGVDVDIGVRGGHTRRRWHRDCHWKGHEEVTATITWSSILPVQLRSQAATTGS